MTWRDEPETCAHIITIRAMVTVKTDHPALRGREALLAYLGEHPEAVEFAQAVRIIPEPSPLHREQLRHELTPEALRAPPPF